MSSQQTRDPHGLLAISHSKTPKKHEKSLDYVFRFLKQYLVRTIHAKVVMARKGYNSCENATYTTHKLWVARNAESEKLVQTLKVWKYSLYELRRTQKTVLIIFQNVQNAAARA